MRATLIGHACWLIETPAGNVLTDPVLQDPFEQGTVTACPARVVDLAALPPLCALSISHRHLDHFDVQTLRRLDHTLPVFCPGDDLLQEALRRIGFTDLRTLRAYEAHTLPGLEIVPIPSVSDAFLEFGSIFVERSASGTATLFNQVDTPLTDDAIARLRALCGPPDAHLAMYASQDFAWFFGRSEDVSTAYARNLSAAIKVGARAVVPAAAGFRFVDDFDFLNRLLFPISRERFVSELSALAPETSVLTVDPGDTLVVEPGAPASVERAAAPWVRMVEDDAWRLQFDPTAPVPPIVDLNHSDYPLAHLRGFVAAVLEEGMPRYLEAGLEVGEAVATEYGRRCATYRVEIVFPDGEDAWSYSFQRGGGVHLSRGRTGPAPDAVWRLTSSGLVDLCEGRRGWFAVRPQGRKWSRMLTLRRTPAGVSAEQTDLPDLLTHFVLNMRIRMRGEQTAMMEYLGLV